MPIVNLGRIGFVNKGNYTANTVYKVNDVVRYDGRVYACLTEHTSPSDGSFISANWQLWVDKAVSSDDSIVSSSKTWSSSKINSEINTATEPTQLLEKVKTVDGAGSGLDADTLDGHDSTYFAPINSPAFTGTPTAPTPPSEDNSTRIATTEFVNLIFNGGKIIKSSNNPTFNTNMPIGTVWANTTTGELFVCVNKTIDKNKWIGQKGTIISTSSVLDIFMDGSCVASYQLNNDANDTGGVYNGTPYDITYVTDNYRQCAFFDGIDSYITMGEWLSTVAASGQLSFSFWQKTTGSIDQTIWSTNSLTLANSVLINAGNCQYWDKNATHYGIDYPNYSDGNWHHYVIIVDTINSKLILYEDSSFIQELAFATGSSILNSSDMSLGRRSGYISSYYSATYYFRRRFGYFRNFRRLIGYTSTYYFSGYIDQVRIFKKALSSEEVVQLYNE